VNPTGFDLARAVNDDSIDVSVEVPIDSVPFSSVTARFASLRREDSTRELIGVAALLIHYRRRW